MIYKKLLQLSREFTGATLVTYGGAPGGLCVQDALAKIRIAHVDESQSGKEPVWESLGSQVQRQILAYALGTSVQG
ncbi:MAG TPA: hypothetical protein V6D17_02650 [Candidatus Obscuribacterales bacterium]